MLAVEVPGERIFAVVEISVFEHIAVVGHADRGGAGDAPLHQVEESARSPDLRDFLFRLGLVPARRLIGARRGEILADVGIVSRFAEDRMLLHRLADGLIARVAHSVVAGQPAALLGEPRHLAVIEHDRKAVLIERRLLARPDRLVIAVMAVPFPLLAVVAHVIVHAPFAVEVRLPLESEIDVLGVVRGLRRDIDDAVLARDRRRFDTAALDDNIAEILLVALVTG